MPANRGKYAQLLAPGLATIFFNKLKLRPPEYEKWINVEKSKRAYEEDWKMSGLGPFVRKLEGGIYTYDEPLPGEKVRYTHLTYGLGFRVTMEMIEDDLYGIMNRMSSELGKSARVNKEVQAASVLNNATNTAYVGYDGKPLLATDHPNLGGGTQANKPAVDADFAEAPLKAALETFEGWTDDRGIPAEIEPWKILSGPAYIWEAGKLLETEHTDTAGQTKNIIRSRYGLTHEVLRYLTDTDAWFVIARKEDHDMKMYIRKNDTFRDFDDPETEDAVFTGHHRLSKGFSHWYGVYGSVGA